MNTLKLKIPCPIFDIQIPQPGAPSVSNTKLMAFIVLIWVKFDDKTSARLSFEINFYNLCRAKITTHEDSLRIAGRKASQAFAFHCYSIAFTFLAAYYSRSAS